MSLIEQKIKELERKLAVKKAYVGAKITFPKSTPVDVRDEAKRALSSICEQLAEGEEISLMSSDLTESEITILKSLAARVAEREKTPTIKPEETNSSEVNGRAKLEMVPETPETPNNMAHITSLDGIEKNLRSKIDPGSKVLVMKEIDANLFRVRDINGHEFAVHADYLEFDRRN